MRSLSSHESVHSYDLMVKKTGGTFDNIKHNNASYSILALEQQWACSYDDCATHAMAYKLGKICQDQGDGGKDIQKTSCIPAAWVLWRDRGILLEVG